MSSTSTTSGVSGAGSSSNAVQRKQSNRMQGAHPFLLSSHIQITGTTVTEKQLSSILTTKKNGFKCLLPVKRHLLNELLQNKSTILECLVQIDKKESSIFNTRFSTIPLLSTSKNEINRMDNEGCAEHMIQAFTVLRELNGLSGPAMRRLEPLLQDFLKVMNDALDAVTVSAEEANCKGKHASFLKGLSLKEIDRRRKRLEGGGKLPDDPVMRSCIYCKCKNSVDEHPENASVEEENKALATGYKEKLENVSLFYCIYRMDENTETILYLVNLILVF